MRELPAAGLGLVCRLVSLLPWRAVRAFGALVVAFAGSILRIRRRQVEEAMRAAGVAKPRSTARAMYASLGAALIEFVWMAGRRTPVRSLVRFTPRAREALGHHLSGEASGEGLVIATAHTGNWDLVACAAAEHGIPITVVTKRLRVGWMDRFWQDTRAERGVDLICGEGAFGRAAAAIDSGRAVAVLVDQAPERTTAVLGTPFLGRPAYSELTAAILAARTGSRLVLALGLRETDGSHTVDIPLVIEPPSKVSRSWIEQTTQRVNAAVEDFVRAHPAQWLWLHRRWKELPPKRRRMPTHPTLAASPTVC